MSNENIRCMPTLKQHRLRNTYNLHPNGTLMFHGTLDEWGQKVYIDETGKRWHEMFWYYSIFHNPIKNIKLQYYHSDDPETPYSVESSEVTVPKKDLICQPDGTIIIHNEFIKTSSFNYKDFRKSSNTKHFFADVIVVVLYCKCCKCCQSEE